MKGLLAFDSRQSEKWPKSGSDTSARTLCTALLYRDITATNWFTKPTTKPTRPTDIHADKLASEQTNKQTSLVNVTRVWLGLEFSGCSYCGQVVNGLDWRLYPLISNGHLRMGEAGKYCSYCCWCKIVSNVVNFDQAPSNQFGSVRQRRFAAGYSLMACLSLEPDEISHSIGSVRFVYFISFDGSYFSKTLQPLEELARAEPSDG